MKRSVTIFSIIFISTFLLIFTAKDVFAASLNVPEITSFTKSTVENNALKLEYKTNNTGTDFSIEVINATTKKTNNLSGSVTSYTYQNLTEGTEYKVQVRACTNSSTEYICSNWSNVATAIAGANNSSKTGEVKSVSLSQTKYIYDKKEKKPTVIVKDKNNKTLVNNTDYTVKYPSKSINTGTYKVVVTGKGNYSFTKELSYKIVLGTPQIIRTMPTEDKVDVSTTGIINQVANGAGIQIAYKKSTSKTYTKFISKGFIPNNFPKKKLSPTTKYNIKVRAFNKINGKNVYSPWSKVINAKTLKKNTKYTKTVLQVSIKNYSYKYTGKNVRPKVTVKNYNTKKTLKKGTDYTVTYPKESKKTGVYSITIKGKGKYSKNYPQYLKYEVIK